MHSSRSYRTGLLLVTTSAIVWSTTGLFTRLITLDQWTVLAWRGLYGALGILAVMLCMSGGKSLREFQNMGWPGWAFAAVSGLGMLCFINAFSYTTVAHVSIIYATVPFVAAALGWLSIREKPSRSASVSSLFALIGVGIMVGIGGEGGWFGDLLALCMTICLATMMTLVRRYPNVPVMPAACLSALLSGLVSIPLANLAIPDTQNMMYLIVFGLVNSALGLSLFTLGSRLLPSVETALISALDAPLAPVWVWLFFYEIPSGPTLLGGTVVFVAVLMHIYVQSTPINRVPTDPSLITR